jgi:tungstate transport system substrate-binding protein
MEIARRGDADVLLTHDPEGEDRFERDGFSELREVVMSNDFIIIGPENDPAKVRGSPTAVDAFCRIAKRESPFISRADRSGTHQRELRLWKECEIEPDGEWYVRSGQGMGAVLRMANEKQAYALGDRSSFLAQRQGTELQILYENPAELTNHYSVIVVSQTKHPHVNREASRKFAEFLLSVEAQRRIADFGRAKYAEPLYRSRDFANP